MLILEIEYMFYLVQTSFTINNYLLNLYTQYSDTNSYKKVNYMYGDNELDNFLVELIEMTEYWSGIENAKYYDSLVKDYHRLADLVRYMYDINYFIKKRRLILKEKNIYHTILSDYQLEDSRLLSFEVNSLYQTCSIRLKNVVVYNDKSISMDMDTILVKFIGTKKIEMKGEINAVDAYANNVYRWCIIETKDGLLSFNLLVLVGHRQFLLHVIHSDIEILQLQN